MSSKPGDDHFAAGMRLAREGKWEEAAAAYREAIRLNPGNADALMNLGFVYYEMGLDREAQEAFAAADVLRRSSKKCNPIEL